MSNRASRRMVRSIASVAAVCLFAFGIIARADTLHNLFQQRYAALKSAMDTRNAAAIAKFMTSDFVNVDVDGENEGVSDMIRELKATPRDPNRTSTTSIVSLNVSRATAVVKQTYDMHTIKMTGKGKQRIELIAHSTDTWRDENGAWLLVRSVTDEMEYYVDGTLRARRSLNGSAMH